MLSALCLGSGQGFVLIVVIYGYVNSNGQLFSGDSSFSELLFVLGSQRTKLILLAFKLKENLGLFVVYY